MKALHKQRQLKGAIRNGDATLGFFVRIPAVQVIESLAQVGADFVVLDAEHAPFGVNDLDHCILAARSVDLPVLVRLGNPSVTNILQVLDMGAAGIVVPHIGSAESAAAAVRATRYSGGSRGFSGQHRAAGYGEISATEYRKASDASVIVIAQIEDMNGHENIADICAVEELDAVFVGRADLTVSMGCDGIGDPPVAAATDEILATAGQAKKTSGIFLPTATEVQAFRDRGVSLFVIGTDQSLLVAAAKSVVSAFDSTHGQER